MKMKASEMRKATRTNLWLFDDLTSQYFNEKSG
jgi:hypothetical protein